MTMTPKEAAEQLNNSQYGKEGSKELFAEMKESGLVAVFGASDDLMEFRGAEHDEIGAYEGAEAYFTPTGLLVNECGNDECPHFNKLRREASIIEALWCDEEGYSWTFKTNIPHVTFEVLEDDDNYCRGIVFALSDVS